MTRRLRAGHTMHTILRARLKPGITIDDLPGTHGPEALAGASVGTRPGADFLGRETCRHEVRPQARRHRHRSDHACRRLRVREPRYARRALEGRRIPLPDARLPRARAPRRDVRHRRRSLRDRIVARDEPGRPEGDRRGSRPRDGDRLRRQHGRHLPPQRAQPRPARRAEPRGRCRRAGRRRVQRSIRRRGG